MVAGYDGQPRHGDARTSTWQRGRTVVDAFVLPVGMDAPLGDDYALEIGMYDPATLERVMIVNQGDNSQTAAVIVRPFQIVTEVAK